MTLLPRRRLPGALAAQASLTRAHDAIAASIDLEPGAPVSVAVVHLAPSAPREAQGERDRLAAHLVSILERLSRSTDVSIRLDRHRFVVVLQDCHSAGARQFLRRLRNALAKELALSRDDLQQLVRLQAVQHNPVRHASAAHLLHEAVGGMDAPAPPRADGYALRRATLGSRAEDPRPLR